MNPFNITQVSQVKPLFDYLKKQRENERFMRYLEISSTFTLIAFFLFFAIRPTALTISSLIGDIKAKQLLETELKGKINNLVKAQILYSQVEGRYQIINASLPDTANYSQAADQIQQTASDDGLTVDAFNFALDPQTENIIDPNTTNYSINLGIKGDFSSIIKMVSDIVANRRIITVNSISLNAQQSNDSSTASASAGTQSQVTTNFGMTFYYWPKSTK